MMDTVGRKDRMDDGMKEMGSRVVVQDREHIPLRYLCRLLVVVS